jgi:hypothetical protein
MIDDRKSTLPKLEEDLYVWEEKLKSCQSIAKLSRKLSFLMKEYSWSFLISWEKEMEITAKEKKSLEELKKDCTNRVEKHMGKLDKAKANYDQNIAFINELNSTIKDLELKEKALSESLKQASEAFKLKETERKKFKMLLDKKEKDKVSFINFYLKKLQV